MGDLGTQWRNCFGRETESNEKSGHFFTHTHTPLLTLGFTENGKIPLLTPFVFLVRVEKVCLCLFAVSGAENNLTFHTWKPRGRTKRKKENIAEKVGK